jgi:carboxymethylenebutenolidase
VVDFYGIFNPRVPVDLSTLRAPVLAHFGDHDGGISREQTDALEAEIQRTGVACTVHHYDAGHAFFNDSRPTVHHAESAALAWTRTLDFLHETLR